MITVAKHNKESESLSGCLQSQRPGAVGSDVEVLTGCWETRPGYELEGMTPDKLDRAEKFEWWPPLLCFDIERHGSTVLGSTRADLHRITVDIDKESVAITKGSYRQVRPKADSLNVEPLCQKVSDLIRNHQVNEKLKWSTDGSVFVKIGQVIPNTGGPKQTLEGRRRRFRERLEEKLRPDGWRQISPNRFMPSRNNDEE